MADENERLTLDGYSKDGRLYALVGDFNDMGKGYDFSGANITFDGSFELKGAQRKLLNAGADYAAISEQMVSEKGADLSKLPYMKGMDLDGNKTISVEEKAAYFLALSMADQNNTKIDRTLTIEGNGQKTTQTTTYDIGNRPTVFDNDISAADIKAARNDPERVAALARQIYYDNNLGGLATQDPVKKATDILKIDNSGTGHEQDTMRRR